jgi:NADH:ubiquinone oxidoreductase subunit 6 (subunit J)
MFEQTLSFPCPSCKEIINDKAEQCKYCGAPIDKGVAQAAAEVQSKVNQAYSDASYLKSTAFAMCTLLAISAIPFVPFVPLMFYGAVFIFPVLLVMLVRWQLKFSNINTPDPDYQKARRNKNIALVLWIVAIPGFILRDLIYLVVRNILS